MRTIDPILNENLRRIQLWNGINVDKTPSGYFELDPAMKENFSGFKWTKDMNAPGSFRDKTKYRFEQIVTGEIFILTMKEMARISSANRWHQATWGGTQMVEGKRKKRGIIRFLGVA